MATFYRKGSLMSRRVVVVGPIEDASLSGPGSVVKVLLSGFDELGIGYDFVNTYNISLCKTIRLFLKLIFHKNYIINVHTFGYKIPYLVMIASKINKNNEYYLTMHGVNSYEYAINGMAKESEKIKKIEKRLVKDFPNIICVSKFLQDYVEKKYSRHKNVFYVNNCVGSTNKKMPKKDNGYIFLYTGGFSNRKNPRGAIEFFSNCCYKKKNGAKMIMCGSRDNVELYNECMHLISRGSLKNAVMVLGKLDKNTLEKYYKEANFIIAPSVFDTFNMSVLEAMSFGCIPIVSNNCGIQDIINNENGYIIERMKEGQSVFMNMKDLSENAFKTAIRFDAGKMAEGYKRIMKI